MADNTSTSLLANYLGKIPSKLLENRKFKHDLILLIKANSTGGSGAVASVFGRTGAVAATSGDYSFVQISSTPTTVAGYGITDAVSLTGVQILTNKTLTAPVISTISNTGTLTLPTSTDTLIGKATTDTLTNKTFNTTGAGNVFQINGVGITAVSGTGAVALVTSPTFVTPALGVASATTVNKVTITAPATAATLTLAEGSTLATSGANSITFTSTGTTTVTLPTSGTLAVLASPTFTGTPAVPTAAQSTNTTQIASTAFVLANALVDDPYITATQLLGSTIKGSAIATSLGHVNSSAALASGTMRFIAVYLKQPATITGIKWVASTIGVYTGDQTNGVALYSYSAGTLTKVAESANTATIWSTAPATNALGNLAFATPYVAAAGVYFVALLYHSSAQTTAPQVGTAPSFSNASVAVSDMTNSASLGGFIVSQTSFPSSQVASGITANTTNIWVGLY